MDKVTNMEFTYENAWGYTDVHVDISIPYVENYQMSMMKYNKLEHLVKIKGCGRDGCSRYTFHVVNGMSMERKFSEKEMKKEDIEEFAGDLLKAVDEMRKHFLNPDHIILMPEMIFWENGMYRFCYLPIENPEYRSSLCISFHKMTEYFVKKLDYHDTQAIIFVYKMHKETLKENYELKSILKESIKEAEKMSEEEPLKNKREKQIKAAEKKDVQANRRKKQEQNLKKFSTDRKSEEQLTGVKRRTEKKEDKGSVKKIINRMKNRKWGEWDDLITEMDGHNKDCHL